MKDILPSLISELLKSSKNGHIQLWEHLTTQLQKLYLGKDMVYPVTCGAWG